MLPHELQNLVPPPGTVAETLQRAQLTREFYQEVQYRQDFERYCQWYYAVAEQHQQELKKMQGDINLFGWFRKGRP